MDNNYPEKRREPRRPAGGAVSFRLADGSTVLGKLLDASAHGFRASHSVQSLASGQDVDFEHSSASGRARVVWNRIASGSVESGFFVLTA